MSSLTLKQSSNAIRLSWKCPAIGKVKSSLMVTSVTAQSLLSLLKRSANKPTLIAWLWSVPYARATNLANHLKACPLPSKSRILSNGKTSSTRLWSRGMKSRRRCVRPSTWMLHLQWTLTSTSTPVPTSIPKRGYRMKLCTLVGRLDLLNLSSQLLWNKGSQEAQPAPLWSVMLTTRETQLSSHIWSPRLETRLNWTSAWTSGTTRQMGRLLITNPSPTPRPAHSGLRRH